MEALRPARYKTAKIDRMEHTPGPLLGLIEEDCGWGVLSASSHDGGLSQHAMGQKPPPLVDKSSHALVKILPCPNFVVCGNYHIILQWACSKYQICTID